jgi:hypothetical protein
LGIVIIVRREARHFLSKPRLLSLQRADGLEERRDFIAEHSELRGKRSALRMTVIVEPGRTIVGSAVLCASFVRAVRFALINEPVRKCAFPERPFEPGVVLFFLPVDPAVLALVGWFGYLVFVSVTGSFEDTSYEVDW